MEILLIGGSVFLGRHFAAEALRRGHRVTTFNRGKSGADVPGAEAVHGDRTDADDLARLVDGRQWDVVIDTSGQVPKWVGQSARALSGHAGTYLFISSVHAYAGWPAGRVDERSPRHDCPANAVEDDVENPNALKAGCERAVEAAFDGKVLIINPGLIIGPYENVGRLPWWLKRIAQGGRVLAPGDPAKEIQLVDARDIAVFGIDQLEKGATGRFITAGVPANATFGSFLRDCVEVTGSDAELVWAGDDFLLEHEVEIWSELPLWAPDRPETANIWRPISVRAAEAGLRCRPVAESIRDTWTWVKELAAPPGSVGMEPEKEARLLALRDGSRA